MKRTHLLVLLILTTLFTSFTIFAAPAPRNDVSALKLEDYVDQVLKTSPLYQASKLQVEGTQEAATEGKLIYSPRFSFVGSYMNDKRAVTSFLTVGTTNVNDGMTFALDQVFPSGTTAKLSYNLQNSKTLGLSPAFASGGIFQFSSAQTQLDLAQPLWKNGFGIETRATADLAEASSLAAHYGEKFKLKQTLGQIESAYYRLAIARESIKLQEEVLDRSKKIVDWASKRAKSGLADKSDSLQANAAYQARQLELETVKNETRAAQLSFNMLRNSTSDEVAETLIPVNTKTILDLTAPARAQVSDDVKAAEQNERIVIANNELARQRAQPDLSLFGTLAYNGVDFNKMMSNASSDAFSTKHPMYQVGVRLNIPLFFWETSEIRSGRVKQQLAAESQTAQTKLTNAQNWDDLSKKFGEAKSRLKLVDELVSAQKEKLDHEKYRFNLGRTTTFQVLTYEQDYATALINRLRIEQEVLALHAQMKAYTE